MYHKNYVNYDHRKDAQIYQLTDRLTKPHKHV